MYRFYYQVLKRTGYEKDGETNTYDWDNPIAEFDNQYDAEDYIKENNLTDCDAVDFEEF